jgi:acetolactate synthase I/II/III large subunit
VKLTSTSSLLLELNGVNSEKVPTILNGAQALLESLLAEGVDTIFGYPGGAIIPTYDALYDYQDRLHHVLVRHEQGAGHAAQGYARVSGKVGVCLATSGPGGTNLVTPIADAMIDCTPLVCIVGQVHSKLLGTKAFQEVDLLGITKPICKWSYQISQPDEVPLVIAKAFAIARSGKPGPVVIDFTRDAQLAKMSAPFRYQKSQKKADTDLVSALQDAAQLINQAQRPYLLFGQGVSLSEASSALKALIEKTDMPCASTLLGLSALPTSHPNYMGMLGMHGHYAPNLMTAQCDVLVAVGMRFDDRVTGDAAQFAPQAKIIHLEIDHSEINRIKKTTIALLGDAKMILQQLLPLVEKRDLSIWKNAFRELEKEEIRLVKNRDLAPIGKLKMAEVLEKLGELTQGEACIVADVGQHQMITARYYPFKNPRCFITTGGLGTMGFALPAALGAKMANPEQTVVGIIGDGCIQMTIQELGTIAQSGLAVKIMVLNNNHLGMVRQWQELFFEQRYSFVELQNPDFVAIAQGFGIKAETCSVRNKLEVALQTMLNYKGAYFLELIVEPEENIFPMIPSGDSVAAIRLQ